MSATLYCGDVREVLRGLLDASVQCCVTSPPYWGLRDYGTAQWDGGEADCDHRQPVGGTRNKGRDRAASGGTFHDSPKVAPGLGMPYLETCARCAARRIDHQLGLERTPEEYVANLVTVFREVRRVLRDDGTLWLNLGDSYASTAPGTRNGSGTGLQTDPGRICQRADWRDSALQLKAKDLVGIPWRVAFALQADGWYLRSDIIWAKPNPMPESVTDRPTKSHEYLFLLTKNERYYYDAAAIAEESSTTENRSGTGKFHLEGTMKARGLALAEPSATRNARSVWTIATRPYPEAHFATFPEELARRCILAGSSAKACEHCGAPWERVTEKVGEIPRRWSANDTPSQADNWRNDNGRATQRVMQTSGLQPTCACENTGSASSVVLDPFAGSGTVAAVATGNAREAIYIDLNPAYLELARQRIGPMLCQEAVA